MQTATSDVEQEVCTALVRPCKYADPSRVRIGIVSGLLQRFPGALEEDPLLRIDALGVTRAVPEEPGIEHVDVLDRAAAIDEARQPRPRGIDTCSTQLLIGERSDRFHTVLEVFPECFHVGRPGKASLHGNNGDALRQGTGRFPVHATSPAARLAGSETPAN